MIDLHRWGQGVKVKGQSPGHDCLFKLLWFNSKCLSWLIIDDNVIVSSSSVRLSDSMMLSSRVGEVKGHRSHSVLPCVSMFTLSTRNSVCEIRVSVLKRVCRNPGWSTIPWNMLFGSCMCKHASSSALESVFALSLLLHTVFLTQG